MGATRRPRLEFFETYFPTKGHGTRPSLNERCVSWKAWKSEGWRLIVTEAEYREFLTYLFERYVRPRSPRLRRRFHHHMEDEWNYHIDQAARAAQVLRFIESHCDSDEEVYDTFTVERLGRAVADTRHSCEFGNRVMEEAGFLDAYEAHAVAIIRGLQPQHLPEVDREVLRELGSQNPDVELRGLVYQAKASLENAEKMSREVTVRQQLRHAESQLAEANREFDEEKKLNNQKSEGGHPKKSRRWFKGLGQISQGAALSIANVALAAGVLRFPVSPETQTWGAVASVTTGIGTILSGLGDLRNE